MNTPPILVMGLGNRLLGDDAVGLVLLEKVSGNGFSRNRLVEFVDGGTQGLALLGYLANRKAVVILDAISRGAAPGAVHILGREQILNLDSDKQCATAHSGNAGDVLRAALLTGALPEDTVAIGIEPECLATQLELSEAAQGAIEKATEAAQRTLRDLLSKL
ncbi:MAG: hydrogenase maturation protease [Candidatus Zixiibacteriota bacterium]|nr:MAG: hydrogenase maturation protease [candidate division Zixibacteria bacterium]